MIKFEVFRNSWLAMGHSTGPEPPCDGSVFNQEESRWEFEIESEHFLAYLRDLSMKENVAIKLVFPPYEHPASDLPIIEILDDPDE